ncbi:hypothetical protein PoB_002756500 [Plakobranchus ocellatus]|uniref:Uncharacterized protein n=1 Tax=Plakobranchus ocellatus TaxID=259542 RepID=A0AAV3ZYX7_9GAST|nr:hypothetical protein PoB_002756500 [Plakobranchus ocellatus]
MGDFNAKVGDERVEDIVGPSGIGTVNVRGTSPQQGDLRFSGPPSGQDAGGGARTRDRRVPVDLRADSLATVPPTPLEEGKGRSKLEGEKERMSCVQD